MVLALGFFLVAILAAFFGFGSAAVTFASTAKLLFYGAVVLFVVTLLGRFMRRV